MAVQPPLQPTSSDGNRISFLHLPPNGQAVSEVMSKRLTRSLIQHILPDSTGDVDYILSQKDVCNDVISVFLGDSGTIVFQPLGAAFTISYAHTISLNRLFDQISMDYIHPSEEKEKSVHPICATSFVVVRDFYKSTRTSSCRISGKVAKAVAELRRLKDTFTALGNGLDRNLSSVDEVLLTSYKIIEELSECYIRPISHLKLSMEKGVVTEAIMTVQRNSMPYPLASVLLKFTTSITDSGAISDWENDDLSLQATLAREYADGVCKDAFKLCNNKEAFLPDLINMGRQSVTKVCYSTPTPVVVEGEKMMEYKVGGVLLLSAHVWNMLTTDKAFKGQIMTGMFADNKKIFFKPTASFSPSDPTKSITMMYGKSESPRNTAQALKDLLDGLEEYKQSGMVAQSMIRLSDEGRRMLGGSALDEENARQSGREATDEMFGTERPYESTRASTASDKLLGTYDVGQPCVFYLHDKVAYVLNTVGQQSLVKQTGSCYNGATGARSPSLTSVQRNVFRTSVGDFTHKCDNVQLWLQTMLLTDTGSTTPFDSIDMLQMKAVYSYTPAVSSEKVCFGSAQVCSALLDPYLHNCKELVEALNANYTELLKHSEREVIHTRESYEMLKKMIKEYSEIYKLYYTSRINDKGGSTSANTIKNVITKTELHPFYSFKFDTETNKFAGVRRKVYLDMPLLDVNVIKLRGVQFLGLGFAQQELKNMNKVVNKILSTTTDIKKDDTDIKGLAVLLLGGLNKVFKSTRWVLKDVHATNTEMLLISHVLMPMFTKTRITSDRDATPDAGEQFTYFKKDSCNVVGNMLVASANLHMLVDRINWEPLVRIAALCMQYTRTTPTALTATVIAKIHCGFTVDFFRAEDIYSEEAVYTVVGGHEMIVTPGKWENTKQEDKAEIIDMECDIFTTRNTLGVSGVRVPCALPNTSGLRHGTIRNTYEPILSRDHIFQSTANTWEQLVVMVKTEEDLGATDHELFEEDNDSLDVSSMASRPKDAFVSMLRPCSEPTTNQIPIIGKDKAWCQHTAKASSTVWERFYTLDVTRTINPYASNMGSLYQMRYTADFINITPHSDFQLRSTRREHNRHQPCLTTTVIEELYDFNKDMNVMSPEEQYFFRLNIAACKKHNGSMLEQVLDKPRRANALQTLDVPAVLGLSVASSHGPSMHMSGDTCRKSTSIRCGSGGPMDVYIMSPFTA